MGITIAHQEVMNKLTTNIFGAIVTCYELIIKISQK